MVTKGYHVVVRDAQCVRSGNVLFDIILKSLILLKTILSEQ